MRILLVEDEYELGVELAAALSRNDYVVDHVMDLEFAREAIASNVHDLVLLDRQLPDGDGLELLAELRRAGNPTPVIVLTAQNDPPSRVAGLDEGADDYIGKPFLIDELLARVRAAGRRSEAYQAKLLCEGNVTLDLTNSEVTVEGCVLSVPRREALLLKLLLRRAGHTVLRRTLEEGIYSWDDEIQSNALDSHVSRLRKRLVDAGANVTIHSIRGVGYLLKADR